VSFVRPASPRRSRLLLSAVVALAVLGGSGCGAGNPLDPPAATVGGVDISADTLQADIKADDKSDASDEEAAATAFQVAGQSEGTYRGDVATFKLADRVRAALVDRLIRREKIEVTAEHITSAKDQLCGGANQETGQPADCTSFEQYPVEYQEFQTTLISQQIALAQTFGPDLQAGLQDEYDQLVEDQDPSLVQSCFDVNAFQTEAEATTAVEAAATTEFEQLSAQYQQLGCIPIDRRDELPPELASIPDGDISAPLADPSGVFVLARRTDSIQTIEEFAQTRIQGGTALTDEILKAELGDVAVQVDPRYGRWDAKVFRVVANERPKGVPEADALTAEGADAQTAGQ
jgi:hypothetical protein